MIINVSSYVHDIDDYLVLTFETFTTLKIYCHTIPSLSHNCHLECRFNVTTMPTLPGVNGTDNRTGIHSGIIKNTDVPEKLIDYSKQYNVSLECIWNITVTPGWKVSEHEKEMERSREFPARNGGRKEWVVLKSHSVIHTGEFDDRRRRPGQRVSEPICSQSTNVIRSSSALSRHG